jgi:hypothetical protein
MPRLRHLLFGLLLLGMIAPSAVGATRPVVDRDTFAGASWLFEKPKGLTGYLAIAFDHRSPTDDAPFAFAAVGKGPCKEKKNTTICRITEGGMWDLKEGEFQIDHVEGYASLQLHRGSFDSSLRWTGIEQPHPLFSETYSTYPDFVYYAHGTHIAQAATIEGKIGARQLDDLGVDATPIFATSVYTGVQYVEGSTFRYGGVTWQL